MTVGVSAGGAEVGGAILAGHQRRGRSMGESGYSGREEPRKRLPQTGIAEAVATNRDRWVGT